MKRIQSFTVLSPVTSSFLNGLQDRVIGLSTGKDNNDFDPSIVGGDGLVWQGEILADTTVRIDYPVVVGTGVDWRDRLVTGYGRFIATNQSVGDSNDQQLNWFGTAPEVSGSNTSGTARQFYGYTGTGAYSAFPSTAVSNGNPPLNAVSGSDRSYYVLVGYDAAGTAPIALYCDPSNGELYLYNFSTTVDAYFILVLNATAKLGKR